MGLRREYAIYGVLLFGVGLVALTDESLPGQNSLPVGAVCLAVLAGAVIRCLSVGVTLTSESVVIANFFTTRRIPIEEVRKFTFAPHRSADETSRRALVLVCERFTGDTGDTGDEVEDIEIAAVVQRFEGMKRTTDRLTDALAQGHAHQFEAELNSLHRWAGSQPCPGTQPDHLDS